MKAQEQGQREKWSILKETLSNHGVEGVDGQWWCTIRQATESQANARPSPVSQRCSMYCVLPRGVLWEAAVLFAEVVSILFNGFIIACSGLALYRQLSKWSQLSSLSLTSRFASALQVCHCSSHHFFLMGRLDGRSAGFCEVWT